MGETVTYVSGDGTGEGYLALPDPVPPATGSVIVLHEWWSGDPHVRAVADRFAAAGLVALVPDLYRGRGLRAGEPDAAGRLLMGLAMDAAASEVGAAARYLTTRGDAGPVGVVGFGMGGSLALWSVARNGYLRTAVAFYPVLPWERMAAKWDGYRDARAVVHVADAGLTPSDPDTAADAVRAAGGEWIRYDYPGTRDGFFNDDRPAGYQRDASALAWARTLEALRAADRRTG